MNADLQRALADMAAARRELLSLVSGAAPAMLARSRPGGWTAARVLQHVIAAEATYAKLLAHQCGVAAADLDTAEPADGIEAAAKLAATRAAVETLVADIDDATVYRLVRFGHEEYSALSVLENIASHDRDHLGQLAELIADTAAERRAPTPAANIEAVRYSGADGTMLTSPSGDSPGIERLRDVATIAVRPAEPRDLPRLNDLYNHYIAHTAITFDLEPWNIEQREEWFGHYATTGRHRLLVAEAGGVVLGYASTSQFRPRRAYETTVEASVVCAPEAVGLGVGRRMYDVLFESIRDEDIHLVVAAITLPNSGSCALHERFGFTRLCVLREVGRKFDQYWDVVWYERQMG